MHFAVRDLAVARTGLKENQQAAADRRSVRRRRLHPEEDMRRRRGWRVLAVELNESSRYARRDQQTMD
jgi:hypothetical protein